MVDEKRLLSEFITLAGFDSESFHEKDIAEYLLAKLNKLGLEASMDRAGAIQTGDEEAAGNIYGFLKGNIQGEPILFSAHMDTVSPGVGKKVIVNEDGRVTSDGTTVLGSDDITAITAILEMLTVIKEKELPHPDIEVVFFIAEELYCKGSKVFDYSKLKSRYAYTLDIDGKVGRVANRAPSIIQYEVTVEGKSAHAGFEPEKGVSAIVAASNIISKLRLGRINSNTTANVGTINGGTGVNIVPELVTIKGEVRSLDKDEASAVVESLRRRFEEGAIENGVRVTFVSEEMVRAYKVAEDSFVIKKYAKALEKLGYGEPDIITSFGGSDNNNFCLHGIEGVVLSNAMNNVHTVSEYFYLDELTKSAEIVLELATGS